MDDHIYISLAFCDIDVSHSDYFYSSIGLNAPQFTGITGSFLG